MTPWIEVLNKLRLLRYEIVINEGRLTYAYQGKGLPPPDQIIPLIDVLKSHKEDIVNDPHFLIDQTLREIDKAWIPGALDG